MRAHQNMKTIRLRLECLEDRAVPSACLPTHGSGSSSQSTTQLDTGSILPIGAPSPSPPSTITVTQGFGGGSNLTGQIYATGSANGWVTVYDLASGAIKFRFQPYAGFTGQVRVAVGDVTGNGQQDVVVAPGPGMQSIIEVFDGATGQMVRSFDAYGSFMGGSFVAVGDINGRGIDDIVTGADAGGGPNVKAFDSAGNVLFNFNAYNVNFHGGVRVAVG